MFIIASFVPELAITPKLLQKSAKGYDSHPGDNSGFSTITGDGVPGISGFS
jgi:hypothetical protein